MTDIMTYLDANKIIVENLKKIGDAKCFNHKELVAEQFCTYPDCIRDSKTFMCKLCSKNHEIEHVSQYIEPISKLFSIESLKQVLSLSERNKEQQLKQASEKIDDILIFFQNSLMKAIQDIIEKTKKHLKESIKTKLDDTSKMLNDYQNMLTTFFSKEPLPDIKTMIQSYLAQNGRLNDYIKVQTEMKNQKDILSSPIVDLLNKLQCKYVKTCADIRLLLQDKVLDVHQLLVSPEKKSPKKSFNQISKFKTVDLRTNSAFASPRKIEIDVQLDQNEKNIIESPEQISNVINQSSPKQNLSIQPSKQLPRLHHESVRKLILFDNNTKIISCSHDKTIIIRDIEENKILHHLKGHGSWIWDMILLNDGRLASCSADRTIKIWNITTGKCQQTLQGHVKWAYCLLELSDNIIISGSNDKTLMLWDLKVKDKFIRGAYHVVENPNQSIIYSLALINKNEIAVSSITDINIYKFSDLFEPIFELRIVLKGHKDWINDLKAITEPKELLISSSHDKECKLWSLADGACIRTFSGHSGWVYSILILSNEIFASASKEIKIWHIDQNNCIKTLTTNQPEKHIYTMSETSKGTIFCCGETKDIQFFDI